MAHQRDRDRATQCSPLLYYREQLRCAGCDLKEKQHVFCIAAVVASSERQTSRSLPSVTAYNLNAAIREVPQQGDGHESDDWSRTAAASMGWIKQRAFLTAFRTWAERAQIFPVVAPNLLAD